MTRRWLAAAAAALGFLTFASAAGAEQLGVTATPVGATPDSCFGPAFVQATDSPATPYAITSDGAITQWQTLTKGDVPKSTLTLLVLRPQQGGSFQVVATDPETLPNPLPAGGHRQLHAGQSNPGAGWG